LPVKIVLPFIKTLPRISQMAGSKKEQSGIRNTEGLLSKFAKMMIFFSQEMFSLYPHHIESKESTCFRGF